MRIEIESERQAVTGDNAALDAQMEACRAQVSSMESVSLTGAGLVGQAFETLEGRLHARTWVLQAHYAAYHAVRTANDANLAALDGLVPSEPDGSVDTDACLQRAEEARARAAEVEGRLADALSSAQGFGGSQGSGKGLSPAAVASIKATYLGAAAVHRAKAQLYDELRERAEAYCSAVDHAYSAAHATASSLLNGSTADVLTCVSTGAWPATMAWASDIGECYQAAYAAHRVAQAKPYLTEDELAAYKAAITGNGQVDATEVYGKDGLNEALWSGLVKLPDNLVTDQEVGEIAAAYLALWDDAVAQHSTEQIERFLDLSFLATGNTDTYHHDSAGIQCLYTYHEFSQAPLLGRLSGSLQGSLSTADTSEGIDQNRLAATNLLATVSSGLPTLWSADKDGVSLSLTVVRDVSGQATLCSLVTNPSIAEDCPYDLAPTASRETLFCTTGNLHAVASMMEDFKDGKFSEGCVLDPGDEWLAQKGLEVAIGLLPGGAAASELVDYAAAVWDNIQQEAARAGYDYHKVAAFADNPLLNGCGFAANLWGSVPEAGIGAFELYATEGQQELISQAISDYGRSQGQFGEAGIIDWSVSPIGKPYTYSTFVEQITGNTAESVIPNAGTNMTASFLEWCEAPADLVYSEASAEHNYTPGEPVEEKIANFDFVSNRVDGGYSNYEFAWEREISQAGGRL